MGSMLSIGELLFSSMGVGATKLKPLKSWWALALGGIPGESEHTNSSLHQQIMCTQVKDFTITVVDRAQMQFPWLQRQLQLIRSAQVCVYVCVCVCKCTFRCFSSELGVEAERVIWFTCCRLEWGLQLSPVQLLRKR